MHIPRRGFLLQAWTITFLSAIAAILPASIAKTQTSTKLKHLEDALLILQGLLPENNKYQHGKPTVIWQGVDGAADYVSIADCSGFISELLSHSYSDYFTAEHFKQWSRTGKRKRPLAENFYYAIANQKDFLQIKKITEVQPGDIIAIKYIRHQDPRTKDNTGHLMLVVEAPKKRRSTKPIIENTVQWEVTIVDQSCSGHGLYDSRRKPDNSDYGSVPDGNNIADNGENSPCTKNKYFYDGLGKGIMRIYANEENDDILGYTWSKLKKSRYSSPDEKPLVIGRLDFN
jgi:hypothetical protein